MKLVSIDREESIEVETLQEALEYAWMHHAIGVDILDEENYIHRLGITRRGDFVGYALFRERSDINDGPMVFKVYKPTTA